MTKRIKLFVLCVSASTLFTLSAIAQSSVPFTFNKVPQSNTAAPPLKRTVTNEATAAAAAAAVQITGKFNVTFRISLRTAVPSGDVVGCALTASAADVDPNTYTVSNEISEVAGTLATVTGTGASCVVQLPYSWYLTNASSDTVDLTYTLVIGSSTPGVSPIRVSSQFVPGAGSLKVPSNGVTTSFTVNAIL